MAYFDDLDAILNNIRDSSSSVPKTSGTESMNAAEASKTPKLKKKIPTTDITPGNQAEAQMLAQYGNGVPLDDMKYFPKSKITAGSGMQAFDTPEKYKTPDETGSNVTLGQMAKDFPGATAIKTAAEISPAGLAYKGLKAGYEKLTAPGDEAYNSQLRASELKRAEADIAEHKLRQANAEKALAEQHPDQAPPGAPPVDQGPKPPAFKGGVEDVMNDFGISRDEFHDKFQKGWARYASSHPGISMFSPVFNPSAAIAGVAMALGPEAVQGVFGKLQDALQPATNNLNKVAKDTDVQAQKLEADNETDRQTLKANAAELAKAGGLNNFGSVLLFVLTSMVIGPKMAIHFFVDKQRSGELEADTHNILSRISQRTKNQENLTQMGAHARMQSGAMQDEAAYRQNERMTEDRQHHFNRLSELKYQADLKIQENRSKGVKDETLPTLKAALGTHQSTLNKLNDRQSHLETLINSGFVKPDDEKKYRAEMANIEKNREFAQKQLDLVEQMLKSRLGNAEPAMATQE